MPKTIIITGASDGVGAAAARQLRHRGHHVVVVGRSARKAQAVAREIGADHHLADFTRLDDVRQLAAALDAAYPSIDVLANNAGGYFAERAETADGFELTFQVNHLAPFLLTKLLMNKLTPSKAAVRSLMTTADKAARHLVWLAESTPGTDWESGRYYQHQRPRTVSPQMRDSNLARELWEHTERSLG